jgi:hypothetical protein
VAGLAGWAVTVVASDSSEQKSSVAIALASWVVLMLCSPRVECEVVFVLKMVVVKFRFFRSSLMITIVNYLVSGDYTYLVLNKAGVVTIIPGYIR